MPPKQKNFFIEELEEYPGAWKIKKVFNPKLGDLDPRI
jgi:hypothetical protein